jgi:hypothetical protein
LLVCSLLILTACLFLISYALAMFTVTWDPCSLFGGLVILPLPAILAVAQYRATFRQNTKAASTSALLLFIIGGLAFLAFAVTLGEMLIEGVRLPWISLLLPMLATGVVGCLAAWINLSWSRRLTKVRPSATNPTAPIRFSVRELLAAVAVIAFVTCLVAHFIRSTPPRYAENVSRDKAPFGLPVNARDISFCQGFRGTIAYEFTIDEADFIAWVRSGIGSIESDAANVPLRPITTPYEIRRFYALSSGLAGPDSTTIANGLYYHWSKEDRGVYAAFDRTTNRAYYFAHFY